MPKTVKKPAKVTKRLTNDYTLSAFTAGWDKLFDADKDRRKPIVKLYKRYLSANRDAWEKAYILPISFVDLAYGLFVSKHRKDGTTWRLWWKKLLYGVLHAPSLLRIDPANPDVKLLKSSIDNPKWFIDRHLPPMAAHPRFYPRFSPYMQADRPNYTSSDPLLTDDQLESLFYMIRAQEDIDVCHAVRGNDAPKGTTTCIGTNDTGRKVTFGSFFAHGYAQQDDKGTFGCIFNKCKLYEYLALWAQLKLVGCDFMCREMIPPSSRDNAIQNFLLNNRWSYQTWILFIGTKFEAEKAKDLQADGWNGWFRKTDTELKDIHLEKVLTVPQWEAMNPRPVNPYVPGQPAPAPHVLDDTTDEE